MLIALAILALIVLAGVLVHVVALDGYGSRPGPSPMLPIGTYDGFSPSVYR